MRQVRHGQSQDEKRRGQDGRGVAEKIGRAARAEYRAGGTAAERGARIRTLALLQQNQCNQGHRDEHQDDFKDRVQHANTLNYKVDESSCHPADRHKLGCFQRGPTGQGAVNVRHVEQVAGVGRLDAAAIDHA